MRSHDTSICSSRSRGNPYHNAQAASFMKTLKVEEVYLDGYETFGNVTARLQRFIEGVYITPSACAQLSATNRPTSSSAHLAQHANSTYSRLRSHEAALERCR